MSPHGRQRSIPALTLMLLCSPECSPPPSPPPRPPPPPSQNVLVLDASTVTASDVAANTWRDTSGRGNNMLLVGVTHSSSEHGGIMKFNGTYDSYAYRSSLTAGSLGTSSGKIWTGECARACLPASLPARPPACLPAYHEVCPHSAAAEGSSLVPAGAGIVWYRDDGTGITADKTMIQLNRSPSNFANQLR
jgi:hypothetical protein